MGYSIYYSRAFIRVGDKYIPLVNSGASNVGDSTNPRLPEKEWGVLNWKRRDRVLFSEAEIREIARDYELNHLDNGMSFRARNKPFAPGEFERWIVGGMSRAHTIEDYHSAGNRLRVVDYPDGMIESWRKQPFTSDEELLTIITQFGKGHEFDISFANNREVYRPARRESQVHGQTGLEPSLCSALFGGPDTAPRMQPADGKPSVIEQIAEAREQQRRAKTESREKPAPVKKSKTAPEL